MPDDLSYRDENTLEKLYHEKEMSTVEMGELFDVDGSTIRKWMDRNDINTRTDEEQQRNWRRKKPVWFGTQKHSGYEYWSHDYKGESYHVYIHRLLAVAKYGFEEVSGMHVHHQKPIQWLNTHTNISLKTPDEHTRHHMQKLDPEDYDEIREKYENTHANTQDLASEYGLHPSTVVRTVNGEYNR